MPPFAMPVWHYLSLHLQHGGQSELLSVADKLGLSDKLGAR
jgi:vitamin B12 transport system ATP-binding protein